MQHLLDLSPQHPFIPGPLFLMLFPSIFPKLLTSKTKLQLTFVLRKTIFSFITFTYIFLFHTYSYFSFYFHTTNSPSFTTTINIIFFSLSGTSYSGFSSKLLGNFLLLASQRYGHHLHQSWHSQLINQKIENPLSFTVWFDKWLTNWVKLWYHSCKYWCMFV